MEDYAGLINRYSSGWKQFPLDYYLQKNEDRPLFIQELISAVNAEKILQYIRQSAARDEDYITSGVCSSQAASAIEFAWDQKFDPSGIDKPYNVYLLAKAKKIVKSEEMIWPGKSKLTLEMREKIESKINYVMNRPFPAPFSITEQELRANYIENSIGTKF